MVCNSSVATMSRLSGEDMLSEQLDDDSFLPVWQPPINEDMGRNRQRIGDSDDYLSHPVMLVLHDQNTWLKQILDRLSTMEERVQHIDTMMGPVAPAIQCPVCKSPMSTLKCLMVHVKRLQKQQGRCRLQRSPRHMALLKADATISEADLQLKKNQFCKEFVDVVKRASRLTGDDGISHVQSWIASLDVE